MPECIIEDASASTADTVFVIGIGIGAGVSGAMPVSTSAYCDAYRGRSLSGPVVIRAEAAAGSDLRDVLDLGAGTPNGERPGVVVTRDPDVLDYARRRGAYIVATLPWTSTYVLLSANSGTTLVPSVAEREALARDAVRTDARAATEPFTWLSDSVCAHLPEGVPPAVPGAVIAYVVGDATSRQLAERIVSLAAAEQGIRWLDAALGTRRPGPLRVTAMQADSIHSALASGRALAAVMAIDRDPRTRCGTQGDAPVRAGVIPLVDIRAHAIVRRGSGAAFLVAPDGSLHFFIRGQQ
jgi:hypothetical protein